MEPAPHRCVSPTGPDFDLNHVNQALRPCTAAAGRSCPRSCVRALQIWSPPTWSSAARWATWALSESASIGAVCVRRSSSSWSLLAACRTCSQLRAAVHAAESSAWRQAAANTGLLVSQDFTAEGALQLVSSTLRLREGPQRVTLPDHTTTWLGACCQTLHNATALCTSLTWVLCRS